MRNVSTFSTKAAFSSLSIRSHVEWKLTAAIRESVDGKEKVQMLWSVAQDECF